MIPLRSIVGIVYFSQTIGEQHFCADYLKTLATSYTLSQFHQPVQAFRVPHSSSKATARTGEPVPLRMRRGKPINVKRLPTTWSS